MEKNRLEAFSDGVIAIIITIMVLDLHAPRPGQLSTPGLQTPPPDQLAALIPILPSFFAYVLSFTYVGIYWNNHHHMLHSTRRVSGGILWANLHLLFWLSLLPFTTDWMGQNHFASTPTAVYGGVLLMAAIAYYILQCAIIAHQGPNSLLASALGRDWKGKISPILYISAIPLAFVSPWISNALFVLVALIWLIPDRRIERVLVGREKE
ncbi:MAG TPA: TMEM175 family protein [Verrucomicrobiae bacterium]|nr:TMEM175 family protein [Verrucomicrobiae bacterium]